MSLFAFRNVLSFIPVKGVEIKNDCLPIHVGAIATSSPTKNQTARRHGHRSKTVPGYVRPGSRDETTTTKRRHSGTHLLGSAPRPFETLRGLVRAHCRDGACGGARESGLYGRPNARPDVRRQGMVGRYPIRELTQKRRPRARRWKRPVDCVTERGHKTLGVISAGRVITVINDDNGGGRDQLLGGGGGGHRVTRPPPAGRVSGFPPSGFRTFGSTMGSETMTRPRWRFGAYTGVIASLPHFTVDRCRVQAAPRHVTRPNRTRRSRERHTRPSWPRNTGDLRTRGVGPARSSSVPAAADAARRDSR